MKAALERLMALGPARLAAMGAVALGLLGLLAFLALRGGSEQMALLYGDPDLRESAQVVEQLGRQHIAHRFAGQGNQIFVPADQVPSARLLLAREGLPSGGSIGYGIFDRGDGLIATQFQQRINETRAMEGELARTIGVTTLQPALPGGSPLALRDPGAAPELAASGVAGLIEDESMMYIANIESQMRASSVRRIAGLVEKHPEETLPIVRGWMAEEPS
jgi:flagellar M-ring protein FliF